VLHPHPGSTSTPTAPSSPSATTDQTKTPNVSGGGVLDTAKSALCFVCYAPSWVPGADAACNACRKAAGLEVGGAGAAIDAALAVPRALAFIFSYRFLEVVGGGLLLLIGVYLLAKQVGINVPAPPAAAALRAAAA
jgi:hypothetical protein